MKFKKMTPEMYENAKKYKCQGDCQNLPCGDCPANYVIGLNTCGGKSAIDEFIKQYEEKNMGIEEYDQITSEIADEIYSSIGKAKKILMSEDVYSGINDYLRITLNTKREFNHCFGLPVEVGNVKSFEVVKEKNMNKEEKIKQLEKEMHETCQKFQSQIDELKCELPKSWEELEYVHGYRHNGERFFNSSGHTCFALSRSAFTTKEQAEASIALAQLSQLMKAYNGDWVPDWNDGTDKYVICNQNGKIKATDWSSYGWFLAFKTPELRDKFLENFRDLIEQAKPLL